MSCPLVPAVCAVATRASRKMTWTHVKRRARVEPTGESEADLLAASMADELAELRMWRDELLRPMSVLGAFDLLDVLVQSDAQPFQFAQHVVAPTRHGRRRNS
mgnify:CR=1 FL=1